MTYKQVASFNRKNVSVGRSPKEYGFTHFAKREFKKGDIITMGFGEVIDHQTPHISIQIGSCAYYLPRKWTGRYWNHSCNPNAYMKTRSDRFPNLVALKKIKKGDEITYAYWMSEYSWSKGADENTVRCKCGEKNCKKSILSFSQLSKGDKLKLIRNKYCARYLMSMSLTSLSTLHAL